MRSRTNPHRHFHRIPSALSVPLFAVIYCTVVATVLCAQAPLSPIQERERAVTLAKTTAVRDAFVARIHANGLSCPIPVPTILVEDVPSFGQYDDKTNVIRTSDWTLLNPQERAFFFQLAGPGAKERTFAPRSTRGLMAGSSSTNWATGGRPAGTSHPRAVRIRWSSGLTASRWHTGVKSIRALSTR